LFWFDFFVFERSFFKTEEPFRKKAAIKAYAEKKKEMILAFLILAKPLQYEEHGTLLSLF
jgi:hypothetical protein